MDLGNNGVQPTEQLGKSGNEERPPVLVIFHPRDTSARMCAHEAKREKALRFPLAKLNSFALGC